MAPGIGRSKHKKDLENSKLNEVDKNCAKTPEVQLPKEAVEFAEQCLQAHNEYRKKHGVPPLTLSLKMSKFATEWAESLAKNDKLSHRPKNEYGENVFMNFSSNPDAKVTGKQPAESWYSEIKDYKSYGSEPQSHNTGHFTQTVWKSSKELGVGYAKSKSGKNYVVANYQPAGNFIGQYAENVLKPK